MAELPLVRQRSVQQSGQLPGYQGVNYSPDDFGAGFGRALQGLGQQGQELARTLKARADETKANDALNWGQQADDELRSWMFDPKDGILAQQGGKALGSGGQAQVIVEDIKRKYLEKISDPETREAFAKLWSRSSEQAKDQAARHELSQLGTYKAETTKAVLLGSMQDAYNNYNDPSAIQKAIETSVTAIRANAAGMSPEMLKVAERDAVSSMHLAVVSRWAVEDPSKGLDYYQAHKDEMHGKDHVAATQFIQPAIINQKAEGIVSEFFNYGGTNLNQIWSNLIQAESSGNPNAESPAGAAGIAQMIPDTARGVAIQLGRNDVAVMSDPEIKSWLKANPVEAEKFGKTYFGDMLKQFGGDIEAALVAYNGGPDNAEAFLKHNAGVPPGSRDYSVPGFSKIKSETEPYVRKILGRHLNQEEPSGWMTPENWTLKNFTPDDLLAPTTGGRQIDARAATALDRLADQMQAQFPGFKIKVNEPPSPGGTTEGRRRGASDPDDNPHVPKSHHVTTRTAIDVQIQDWNDVQKATFLSLARQAGFGGIGFYGPNGHLHIDMGSPRSWGRIPQWAKTAMQVPIGQVAGGPAGPVQSGAPGFPTPQGRGSYYVGVDTPDQLAFLEMASAIEDTTLRERVLSLGRVQIAREEAIVKQADAANKTMAWEHVANGGSTRELPPQLVAKLDPSVMNSMRAYEEGREVGIETNWQAYAGLKNMSPEQLLQIDAYDYRPMLADAEFKELVNAKAQAAAAARGDPSAQAWAAQQATRADLMREYSITTGWDKDSEQMALLSRKLDERIRMDFAGTDKKPDAVQLRDILDKLLITEEIGFWRSAIRSPRAAMDVTPDEASTFIAAQDWDTVQQDDQMAVLSAYRQYFNQDPPDKDVAVDIYNRAMQVWLGAPPTGPEEEEAAFRQSLQAEFAAAGLTRQITEPEFEKYYGEWLLTFLGRQRVR